MKTNVTLQSTDRVLFGVTIKQDTNSMLSISDLQKAYETARWQYGWSDRKVADILNTTVTKERMFYILKERDVIKTDIVGFMEMVDNSGLTSVLKGLGVYKTTGKGATKTVMADPYVWVLLAMELNPMLYAKVIMWLTDTLIFNRIEAGNEYMPMNAAIKSIVEKPDYSRYAIAINKKVFGTHQTGMRNLASASELRKISDIEKFVVNAIGNGWLKSEMNVLQAIEGYK